MEHNKPEKPIPELFSFDAYEHVICHTEIKWDILLGMHHISYGN